MHPSQIMIVFYYMPKFNKTCFEFNKGEAIGVTGLLSMSDIIVCGLFFTVTVVVLMFVSDNCEVYSGLKIHDSYYKSLTFMSIYFQRV